jgi:hypothetical protein
MIANCMIKARQQLVLANKITYEAFISNVMELSRKGEEN